MCTECWSEEDPYIYPVPAGDVEYGYGEANCPCSGCEELYGRPAVMTPPKSCIQDSAGLLARTLQGKNNDYRVDGEFSNFERAADFASTAPIKVMMTQIAIKYTRIQGGLRSDESFNYESLKDSLLDLAGYAVIAHAYLSKDS